MSLPEPGPLSVPRRNAELDRYLLDGERLVTAVHQHWAKVAEPVGSVLLGAVLALWLDARIPASVGWLTTGTWWLWFALVARMAYRVAEWRHDWFVATDKRLLLFYGFITRKVAMMPLMKVTDMSYERSVPGRLLGYGRFVMESAGQDQALHEVNWVPQPDHNYRVICAEMFRGSGRDQGRGAPWGGPGQPWDDQWDEPQKQEPWVDEPWTEPVPVRADLPDPYAGWNSPRHTPAHPTAGDPGPSSGDQGDTLYRSPDLRARDRSADTGPIPLRRRRAREDDER
ncbi:PH domain-containing protein [Pedococcus sp. NPDC057267]|uniref:PH domain-containing protein n=1 Tax=Pedococcus sp. NPDC057267 TaxID=3346077 RepID=UPI00362765EB